MTRIRPEIIKVFEPGYGRSAGGDAMISYSFNVTIGSGVQGVFDLPVVATGQENIYQCITISCYDDASVHVVNLVRASDNWVFFSVGFVTGGIFDFPGEPMSAGNIVRVLITNNSIGNVTFIGAVNYTIRNI